MITPLEAARRLTPEIRACAADIDSQRELPRALFEQIADAGLFQLALPRSLGCPELDLPSYVQVIAEIARADASTAWAINQGAVFATFAARMPQAGARAIWIDTPRAVVANTPMATMTAQAVPGGYQVSGRGGFSTGCRHAFWLAAHAKIFEGAEQRTHASGERETRFLFVPATAAQILDTWQVRGMRGTGTNHFEIAGVFVPEERTVLSHPDPALFEDRPLYRVPRTLLFASGDAATALSVARAALDAFVELAGAKTPRRVIGLLREQPMVQADVGLAEAWLRSGEALLSQTVSRIWEAAVENAVEMDQRAALRLAATHAIRLAVDVVDCVYNAAGATAVYESHILQRYFQDIHVISQHIQSRRAHYELVGKYRLGLDIEGEEGI